MFTGTQITRQKTLVAAVSLALGASLVPQAASATVYTFNWSGYFTMLTSTGAALGNTSITTKGANTYQTPVTGTLTYDDAAHTGSMTINAFDFYNGTAPAVASGVTLSDTDGAGAGTLLLGNMLFDWNGNNGIPVSIVWDAAGLLSYLAGTPTVGDTVSGTGAAPASDGTYVGATVPNTSAGYLALGPTMVSTTEWNTSLAAGCTNGVDSNYADNTGGGCMGVNPSGALPLVTDTAANANEYAQGDGLGVGGNPMADGPFTGFNANFDLTSLTLISDGSGPVFTEPPDVSTTATAVLGDTVTVDLGTVTDETGGVTIEYSTDGLPISDGAKVWTPDDGANNPYGVTVTDTVNTLTVDWRADDGIAQSFATQTVTVTINDAAAPTFSSVPADFSVTVNSTAETIIFEGPTSGHGTIAASDTVDAAPVVEWSLDGLNWTVDTAGTDESSNAFASGINIVYWRATDDSFVDPVTTPNNYVIYEQRVTVNLPTGIVGQPCTVDGDLLNAAIGNRLLEGTFTMRDPAGAVVGTIDPYVTGWINTATVCTDESCTDSGAELSSPTPFYGNLWTTNTIRLFNQPGNYSFNAIEDGNPSLGMTVGTNQLGAHMLFDWSVNRNIDVVLVWNYGCGDAELVTTDPDGDGIIGTRMVDGPFQGFNAAFDLRTVDGESPITTGGYSVTIPAANNPVANTSPLPVDPGTIGITLGGITFTADQLSATGAASDSRVVSSCVGGCFDFSVSGRTPGETIQVVLPLSEPIPYYALYRKYTAATNSWGDYAVSGSDSVMTAPLNEDGRCPEPGAGDYTSYSSGILPGMLRPGDQCVQLTITDNGPNDSDPADGVIADPSGVGLTSAPATPEAATSSGCTLATRPASLAKAGDWLLVGLALAGLALFRRRTA